MVHASRADRERGGRLASRGCLLQRRCGRVLLRRERARRHVVEAVALRVAYTERVRILFAGTPQASVPSLQRLLDAGHDVLAVLTRAPAPAGRRHKLVRSAVHEEADARGIPVYTPTSLKKDEDVRRAIEELAPEAVAVVAYGLLIPPALLEIPRFGWINLHFSLLPQWRGAAPVQYAIAAGQETTGASTFRLEAGLDTGPVFGSVVEKVGERETAGELLERLSHSGAGLLVETFERLGRGAEPVPQSGEPSYAPSISTADARVDWNLDAVTIDRRSRAHTPAPGPWTTLGGTRIKLGPLAARPDVVDLQPGQIRSGKPPLAGTGAGAVELSGVAPAGKKPMDASAWLRGARLAPETRFDAEGE